MIPDSQSIMLLFLRLFADKEERTIREAIEKLAEHFNLMDEERRELLSSGKQSIFNNCTGQVCTELCSEKDFNISKNIIQ